MCRYKTGELARKADVSIRTIRYYDKQGLLKPSKITESGYRLYTNSDLIKLQKILCLKYLGFSLEEIFAMTISDSYLSLKETLKMQTKLINQKIDNLKDIQSSLNETINLIENDRSVDWSEIIKTIHMNSMERDLLEQYKNATNVDIRIRLHDKYSQSKISWFRWLFSHYNLNEDSKILEIGCGNGKLWGENKNNIKGSIILSDISKGMIEDAKNNIGLVNNMSYQCIDCQKIPFDDNSFDIIIANHVLFYIKDISKALSEINRVLKPEGILYCSTYGKEHMKEITSLVKGYDPRIVLSNLQLYDVFGLDNGKSILQEYFGDILVDKYIDSLEVDNMDDIANYILSCHGNQSEYISKNYQSFKSFIERKLKKTKSFHISKDAGLFICRKKHKSLDHYAT